MGRPVGSNGYTAQQFIDAIPGSGGIVSTIAKRVGCAWHTAKKYCTQYATVAKVYQDEVESVGDLAESILLDNLQKARKRQVEDNAIVETTDAKWYLTMKAKDRGYAERREIAGVPDAPFTIVYKERDPDKGN